MDVELAAWRDALSLKVEQLLATVAGLDEEELNRRPGLEGANSPFVIVTHVLGNMRAWVLGIACEEPLRRDRASEFRARGTGPEMEQAARELLAAMVLAIERLEANSLDDRIQPSQELFGEGQARELTRREALLHPLEHAAIHLGQLQLTVDLLRATPT